MVRVPLGLVMRVHIYQACSPRWYRQGSLGVIWFSTEGDISFVKTHWLIIDFQRVKAKIGYSDGVGPPGEEPDLGRKDTIMNIDTIRANLTYEAPRDDGDRRLRELVVYISGKFLTAEFFGVVKLNKTLFHSDMRSFRRYGEAITGNKYKKDERGPVPVGIKPVQDDMERHGQIAVVYQEVHGLTQHRVVPLRKPDLTLFSGRDIAVVDEVIAELWNKTGKQVSQESHGVQWNTRALEDRIPYEASYLSDEPITPADIERTAALAKRFGWATA
jgi:hypothetical protein